MSLALATKGIISGVGFGSGAGDGGLYPDGYIASAIEVAVDLATTEISVVVDDPLEVSIDLSEIEVAVDVSDLTVDVLVNDPELEVDV